LIKHSIQSLGKFILLSLVFTTLLFSGGKQDVENESGNPAEQLEQFQQQLQEVEGKLKAIPQAQEKIKDLEKLRSKTLNRQKKLAKLALSLRKKCNIKKARDEINGLSYERIEKRYRTCKRRVDRLLGKNGFSHRKFMRDIKKFKKMVQNHIYKAEDLIDKSNLLENKRKYLKISLEQLKEMANTK